MISADEVADAERSFKRLLFAAQDMGECHAAVEFLQEKDDIPGQVRRTLETGAVVAYARPWGKNEGIGKLGDHWLPRDRKGLALHEQLIEVRHKVYAHTDEEIGARWVSGMHGTPAPSENQRHSFRHGAP